jgi:hypothetical protein
VDATTDDIGPHDWVTPRRRRKRAAKAMRGDLADLLREAPRDIACRAEAVAVLDTHPAPPTQIG